MALLLAPEEPEAGLWRVELLSTLAQAVIRRGPDRSSSGRPPVLAVDGRSNNGKTTVLPAAAMGRERPAGLYRGSGRLLAADYRRRRRRAA